MEVKSRKATGLEAGCILAGLGSVRSLPRRAARLAFVLSTCSAFVVTGCGGKQLSLVKDGPAAQAQMAKEQQDAEQKAAAGADDSWFNLDKLNPVAWFAPADNTKAPADSLVLRGGDLVADQSAAADAKAGAALAAAQELYRKDDYDTARAAFAKIANDTKMPTAIAEEARFYEAECYRRMEKYPTASDTYHKMLLDHPTGSFREQAVQRMFDIGNYWLEDTRKEMAMYDEQKAGKRWFVITPLVHFEKSKPTIDQEGRAMEVLERVRYNDMQGPLADKSLFLAGTVKFWREDYREADYYFTQLAENHPNSELAPRAIELGIIAKHMGTGGSDYDGRKVAEARKLINTALQNYPTLAKDPEKEKFLTRQLINCNLQQAEKDFKIAEFYRRTNHPGSAYFYYEIVRRRYPGTKYADQATERMHELHAKAEKELGKTVPPVPSAASAPPAASPERAPTPRPAAPLGLTQQQQ